MEYLFIGKRDNITGLLGWLLAVILILQGLFPGLVMCFGDNGHMVVEMPHSPFGHPTSQSQAPCLDLPLLSVQSDAPPLVIPSEQALQRLGPVLIFFSTPLTLFVGVLAADALLRLTPGTGLLGVSLPTVALRI